MPIFLELRNSLTVKQNGNLGAFVTGWLDGVSVGQVPSNVSTILPGIYRFWINVSSVLLWGWSAVARSNDRMAKLLLVSISALT